MSPANDADDVAAPLQTRGHQLTPRQGPVSSAGRRTRRRCLGCLASWRYLSPADCALCDAWNYRNSVFITHSGEQLSTGSLLLIMIVVAVENGINTFPVAMLQVLALAAIWTQLRLRIFVCRHYCDELDLNHASPPLPSTSQSPAQWKHEYWCLTVWPSGHSLNTRVVLALWKALSDEPQICDNWVINSKLGWMTHLCSVFGYYWQELLSILSQLTGC